MTHARFYLALGAVAGLLATTASGADDPLYDVIVDEPGNESIADAVDAVRSAPDPSAAVEAYTRGQVDHADQTALLEAYVDRMAEFDAPELAGAQAELLAQRQPDNGRAWAVTAEARARRGEMVGALEAIVKAVRLRPDDSFVQRTAGRLIGWYDAQRDRLNVPEALQRALAEIRSRLAEHRAFTDAYRAAREAAEEGARVAPVPPAPPIEPEPVYVGPSPIYGGIGVYGGYNAWPFVSYPAYGRTYYSGGCAPWRISLNRHRHSYACPPVTVQERPIFQIRQGSRQDLRPSRRHFDVRPSGQRPSRGLSDARAGLFPWAGHRDSTPAARSGSSNRGSGGRSPALRPGVRAGPSPRANSPSNSRRPAGIQQRAGQSRGGSLAPAAPRGQSAPRSIGASRGSSVSRRAIAPRGSSTPRSVPRGAIRPGGSRSRR